MSDASTPTDPSAGDAARPDAKGALPVNFAQFVVSLGSSALVHLGEIPEPASGEKEVDLVLARHSIDLLGLLKEKTRGNLDDEETRLLDALLFDLRQKYAEVAGA